MKSNERAANCMLRLATSDDLDFLIRIDIEDEGCASPEQYSANELVSHRAKIAAFLTNEDHRAWILDDVEAGGKAGVIMYRFRDAVDLQANSEDAIVLYALGDNWPAPDRRYCSVFQLWIDPNYRRQRLAMRLKQHMQFDALANGIHVLYTHTEEQNFHVIALNERLGYHEIRRGPIWDDVIRVSLAKFLALDHKTGFGGS